MGPQACVAVRGLSNISAANPLVVQRATETPTTKVSFERFPAVVAAELLDRRVVARYTPLPFT